ncbi:MAG TPA: Asp/Glu/hydantoin racemase [Clostridiales bacterium]|nr:Asp/Glu/hydantoin racemase [Clostridiales bacterium]
MKSKIAIVQTSLVSHKELNAMFAQKAPDIKVYNIVDDSLLHEVSTNGHITAGIVNRMCKYFDAASSLGVDLILNQCSSVGEAAQIAARTVNVPVLRIDQPMAEEAVKLGTRIGVVATVGSTVTPSCNLIKDMAVKANKPVEVIPYLVNGALDVLMREGQAKHNALVKDTVIQCAEECDVVVLAQGSMIILLPVLNDIKKPVLSSPESGVDRAIELLRQKL